MSFTSRRDDDRLFFTSKRPHFFKIILGDDIQTERLAIPRKFVKNYGSGLSDPVCLRVPSGAVWQVGLSKHCKNVWLQNGWREFSEYYSLDYGHLLVFELESCNQFSVFMFDKSATEMKYPCYNTFCTEEAKRNGECKEPSKRGKTEDEDSAIEMLGGFSISHSRFRGIAPLPCPHSKKKMKNYSTSQIEGPSFPHLHLRQIGNECRPEASQWVAKECAVRGGMSTSTGVTKQKCSLTSKNDVKAFAIASDFQSEYPYFKVVLTPTYVGRGYKLVIPAAFAKKYFKEMQRDVTLYVPDGRAWSVKIHHWDRWSYLCRGWRKFSCDNGLKVDDVCFFELIQISEIMFKVTIFRVDDGVHFARGHKSRPKRVSDIRQNCSRYSTRLKAETSHRCMKESGGSEKTFLINGGMPTGFRCLKSDVVEPTWSLNSKKICQAFEQASVFQSGSPFFKLVIRPSYVHACGFAGVTIPREFARKYLREKQSDVTLFVSDKGFWPAEYRNKSYGKTILYHGWKEFVRDNSLKVDDVCVFELIEISEFKFKVFIFRVNEDLNNQLSLGRGSRKNRVESMRSLEKNDQLTRKETEAEIW